MKNQKEMERRGKEHKIKETETWVPTDLEHFF